LGELHDGADALLRSLERKLADLRIGGETPEIVAELEALLAEIRANLRHTD
jgi:hypothetical protein